MSLVEVLHEATDGRAIPVEIMSLAHVYDRASTPLQFGMIVQIVGEINFLRNTDVPVPRAHDVQGAPELAGFALKAMGAPVLLQNEPLKYPMRGLSDIQKCPDAEPNFVHALTQPEKGKTAGIVYRSQTGNPVLFRKGYGEPSAINLEPITVGDRTLQPGWLLGIKQRGLGANRQSQRLNMKVLAEHTGSQLVSDTTQIIESLYPMRLTAFAPQTEEGIEAAQSFCGIDVDLNTYNLNWIRSMLEQLRSTI